MTEHHYHSLSTINRSAFYLYRDVSHADYCQEVKEVCFNLGKSVESVYHYYFDNQGKLIKSLRCWGDKGDSFDYYWNNNLLTKRVNWRWEARHPIKDFKNWNDIVEREYHIQYLFDYAIDGSLQSIKSQYLHNGEPSSELRLEYQKSKKGESLRSLSKEIEGFLLKEIPKKVSEIVNQNNASKLNSSTAIILFLSYSSSNCDIPPCLMLVTEEDKKRLGERDIWFLHEVGNPWIEFSQAEFKERWKVFETLFEKQEKFDVPIKLMRGVAKKLNKLDWSKIINVAENFVVTAADSSDGFEITDDVKASVPYMKRRKLILP